MGTHSQHTHHCFHLWTNTLSRDQGGRAGSGTATFWAGCICSSPGCQGLIPTPGDPTENSTATTAPCEIYLGNLAACWCSRLVGFSILVLYDGRETKTLYPKVRPKVKAQALTQTPKHTVLGFGLAGKQEGESRKLPLAKLPIYTTERELKAKKIFYS